MEGLLRYIGFVVLFMEIERSLATYLYRISPGIRFMQSPAGLYGGEINMADNGNATNLYASGYNRAKYASTHMTGISLKTVSYDPISKEVLLHFNEVSTTRLYLGKGPLCRGLKEYPEMLFAARYLTAETPTFDNRDFFFSFDAGFCGIAYHNSKIYFMLLGTYGNYRDFENYVVRLELRVLEGCEDSWNKSTSWEFNILKCSRLIANVTEDYKSRGNWRKRLFRVKGGELKLHIDPETNKKVFFYQIFNRTLGENEDEVKTTIDLLQITEDGSVTLLHREAILNEDNSHTVGIDYKDGTLCWSTTVSVICAILENGRLSNHHTILKDGEAESICSFLSGPSKTVTGVAIADVTQDKLDVYFGCKAGIGGLGGLGLIKYDKTKDSGAANVKSIVRVTSSNASVLGGPLFLTEDKPINCQPGKYDLISTTPSNTYTNTANSLTLTTYGLLISLILWVYLYIVV
ncbi:unnamed protein product [Owenia fusiformis]|uniref:Uncharacterized protein n=1 Tax=Owenia fusiformis TaxID=6347 RepID=A0A8J1U842_OWEFU|nr:unnamed protein product [Owenia fusiformis]